MGWKMMKMAAVSTIALLLLCCFIASTDSQETCDHHAATGGNFTVQLNHKLDNTEQLKWRHNQKIIVHRNKKGVFVNGTKEDIYENGSLKLTNLKIENAGKYKPEVYDKAGRGITDLKTIQLCVMDPVTKPTMKVECPSQNVKFTCNVGQVKDLKFEWLQDDKVMADQKVNTLKLNAEKAGQHSFSCRVSNPVSTLTSTPAKQNCIKPTSIIPETIFGINTWIIVGSGGGVVLLLIILVIICCIRTRRRRRMQLREEGELRLAWTNEKQQHHHQHNHSSDEQQQHHHHHQQQPAGHTGPRQPRSKQHRDQPRTRAPDQGHPKASPRRPAQAPPIPVANVDEEQPPPLPQPRKKAPKTPRE